MRVEVLLCFASLQALDQPSINSTTAALQHEEGEPRFSCFSLWSSWRRFTPCCLTSQRRQEVASAEVHRVRISASKGYFYIRDVSPEGLKSAAAEETTASFSHRSFGVMPLFIGNGDVAFKLSISEILSTA